ncbi:TniQ family protein [Rhizobium laguerreae]|uniref:TniQ family protein n=1 Tax=Rhizobium laguerreae TaxID=1076926 RepID=UPI001C912357|nr:TniQ family protein [Rhizobium laguerreae]MBY3233450.1 TniQ family protein [Rhizobium laguerreae]
MTVLARVPELGPIEPLPAYMSRLAAANGASSLRDFRRHMGFRIERWTETTDACDRLSDVTGIDVGVLMSRNLNFDRQWFSFGTQRLPTPALIQTAPRYCPKCIEDDFNNGAGRLDVRLRTRFPWLVAHIDVCPEHRVELVTSPLKYRGDMKLDFAAHVRTNWREIEKSITQSKDAEVHPYESYFFDRVAGNQTSNELLDPLPCFAALRLCTIIGEMLAPDTRRGRAGVRIGLNHPSRKIGFDVLSSRSSLLSFLTEAGDSFVSDHHRKALGLYGKFGEYLAANMEMAELQPMIEMVRNHAYETVPIGPEYGFLGGGGVRRWHTLRSAELETGVYFTVLRKILVERGVIPPSERGKKDSSIVVSVADVEVAAADYHDRIGLEELADRLGLLFITVRRLVRAGLFKSTYGTTSTLKEKFSRRDTDAMLEQWMDGLETAPLAGDLVSLRSVGRRFSRQSTEVILAYVDGKLSTRYLDEDASKIGFERILVDRREVRALLFDQPPGLKIHELAYKFGLQRPPGKALFYAGFFEILRWEPGQGRNAFDVATFESVERFFREYDSLTNFAEGWMKRGDLHRGLKAAGIKPFWSHTGNSVNNIFNRLDIEEFRSRSL